MANPAIFSDYLQGSYSDSSDSYSDTSSVYWELDHIFGSLGFLDKLFGVMQATPPMRVTQSLNMVAGVWGGLFVIEMIASAICLHEVSMVIIPRVVLAMGCLYRHIDPWYRMVPRMITCGYLHHTPLHLVMNVMSLSGSYVWWRRTAGRDLSLAWLDYHAFPMWFLGTISGSFFSYTSTLGHSGAFTVGGSGGVCGYAAYVMLLTFLMSSLSEGQLNALIGMAFIALIQILPLQGGQRGSSMDYMSHAGGTAMGLGYALLLNHLRDRWPELALRRLGVVLTVTFTLLSVISFLEVVRQFLTGHADRVAKAYFRWMKLDELIKLKEKRPGEPRRWTVGQIEGIEYSLNVNQRDPLRPLTSEEREAELLRKAWRLAEEERQQLLHRHVSAEV